MRTPKTEPNLALIGGEHYFYSSLGAFFVCSHSPYAMMFGQDTGKPTICGICWLENYFQAEIPLQLHSAIKNGKTRTWDFTGRFYSHLEAHLGLVPPRPDQKLSEYRRARAGAFRQPSRKALPVTWSLWEMMGYQPKLARALLMTLLGAEPLGVASHLDVSLYQAHATIGKGVRTALRYLRN